MVIAASASVIDAPAWPDITGSGDLCKGTDGPSSKSGVCQKWSGQTYIHTYIIVCARNGQAKHTYTHTKLFVPEINGQAKHTYI
jgi:hypothetical protein